jgi:hypothetical protein
MRWLTAAGSLSIALVGQCLAAQAAASSCQVEASPSNPADFSEAFARSDVSFSTAIHIQCFDPTDAPVSADNVCLSARRDEISGGFQFIGNGRSIPYRVEANGKQIGEVEQEVWSGSVAATGEEIGVSYAVSADDFVGFPGGGYFATTIWTAHLNADSCP